MRPTVRAAFLGFSTGFEGAVPFPYLDQKNLVTIAIGILIDPLPMAASLPLVHPDGSAASWQQIEEAWHAVKARTDLAQHGGMAFRNVTTLRLTAEGLQDVVLAKLASMEKQLVTRFSSFLHAPADAQLAALSVAWAAGANAHMPKFAAAFEATDWATCAQECHLEDSHNPGLRPRNAANEKLFANAAAVKAQSLDPDVLYYPGEPTAGGEIAFADTEPEGPAA